MPEYIKCPRCELNYIKKGEQYCQVCKAELKLGPQLMFAVDEDDEDYEDDEDEDDEDDDEDKSEDDDDLDDDFDDDFDDDM